ncbi:hypothetical protein FNV43_RR01529 [Rhamnella rubrinervis]|uniref:PGG domain-containing protein n=1 Tax=Rhamnella rubrinervis TaxID=2594499 RepID=A0A8K0MTE3_9ROSA|nr:hypothetical protein FNV43_RR01529 [Rhamnella rubrinervis]
MSREAAYMKNRDGNTALHLATVSDNKEIVLEIIKQCPDSSELVNTRGWNILHLAAQDDSFQTPIRDILKTRSSLSNLINEKDAIGNTPLHHIAVSVDRGRLNDLIGHPRVDKLVYNNENKNALDLASNSNVFRFVEKKFRKDLKKYGLRSGMRIYTSIKDSKQDNEEERDLEELKKVQDANVIVATLIATVTFAAGFTIPGGYPVSDSSKKSGSSGLGDELTSSIIRHKMAEPKRDIFRRHFVLE